MNPLFPKYRLLLFVAVGIAFFTLPVYSQTVMGGDTMDYSTPHLPDKKQARIGYTTERVLRFLDGRRFGYHQES